MWAREPEREHLFKKQISKHSVGAYMELCREVGLSIKGVAPSCELPQISTSFTQENDQLRAENKKLIDELSLTTNRIGIECMAREMAETRVGELEGQLLMTQKREDAVARENGHLSLRIKRLTKRIGQSDKEVKRALSRLSRLDSGRTKL